MVDPVTPPLEDEVSAGGVTQEAQDELLCDAVIRNCRSAETFLRDVAPLIPRMTDGQFTRLRSAVGALKTQVWICDIAMDAEMARRSAAKTGRGHRDDEGEGITAAVRQVAEMRGKDTKTIEKNIQVHKTFFADPQVAKTSLDIAESLGKSFFYEAVRAPQQHKSIREMYDKVIEAKSKGRRYTCQDARHDVDDEKRQIRCEERRIEAERHGTVQGLWCGDCRVIAKGWPAKSVKTLLIDPPYGVAYKGKATAGLAHTAIAGDRNVREAISLLRGGLQSVDHAMCDECHVICFCDAEYEAVFCRVLHRAGYAVRARCVWHKTGFSQGDVGSFSPDHERFIHATRGKAALQPRLSDVIICPRLHPSLKRHGCQKPLAMFVGMINSCTVAGETVADLFAGVGSSLVAAKSLGRGFLGVELEQEYYGIAVARLQSPQAEVEKEAKAGSVIMTSKQLVPAQTFRLDSPMTPVHQ